MAYSALLAVSTDIWIAIVVPIVLYLLVVGPVLAVSLYAVWRRSPDANDRAVDDVARFVVRERARAELAATGSIDRFNARARFVRQHTPARPARVSDATRAAPCAAVALSQARVKRVLGAKAP
jgi:hypothetical protein